MNPSPARLVSQPGVKWITCSACGAKYGEDAWRGLALSQRIEPLEVRRHVLEWPENLAVEVRACGACKAMIARKK